MSDRIERFVGPYAFLSNFYPCEFVWDDIVWKHSEGAYQAAKTLERDGRLIMSRIHKPGETKALGKRITLREDWNEVKDGIMLDIVRAKFRQNLDLAQKLVDTGDAVLEEGNYWNDRYWGVCPAGSVHGQNKLGKILMIVREELKQGDNQ